MDPCVCSSADQQKNTYKQEWFSWKVCFHCGKWMIPIVKHNNMGMSTSHYKPSDDGH